MSVIETLAIQPNVYYTPEEAAQLLRVSEKDILEMLQSGRARGVQIGEHWRVLGAALLDLSVLEHENDAALVRDWMRASLPSLMEVWDNEEDAVYDDL